MTDERGASAGGRSIETGTDREAIAGRRSRAAADDLSRREEVHEKAPAGGGGFFVSAMDAASWAVYWIETLVIVTGSLGREGVEASVSACSIVVTTSMPETTLP